MINQLFDVPVYYTNVGTQLKVEIQKEIDSVMMEIGSFLNDDCWDHEILSTFNAISSTIHRFNLNNLADAILHHTTVFLNGASTEHFNFYLSESWLNSGTPGSFQYQHMHADQRDINPCISGVYYISVPENSGNIIFFNPSQLAIFNKLTAQKSHINYTPNDGDLLLFPSNLPHKVGINKSDKNRLSISFNIVCESVS
jgi:uncharacterized protein (TIGR02466 family)